MRAIDVNEWKPFVIGDLFRIEKGTRLTKADMKEGDIRFIGASAVNNGLTGLIGNDEHLYPKNTLTVCYNGSVGFSFYQDEPYWASDDINVLHPKFEMNRNIGLFIAPLIRIARRMHSFVDKWTKEIMLKDTIILPTNYEGKPDFDYMNTFMQKVLEESEKNLNCLLIAEKNKNELDTEKWREVRIGDVFPEIIKPQVFHSKDVKEDKAGIPYIVRTKFNNGIKYRVKKTDKMNPNPAGVITFGAENAAFFYQDEEFVSGRDIYYIDVRHLNKSIALFITTCLQSLSHKYPYNYGLFPRLLKEEKIKLPVTGEGKPDWKYMDSYIADLFSREKDSLEKMEMI